MQNLQELEDRVRNGGTLSEDEALYLIRTLRRSIHDLEGMDNLYNGLSLQMAGLRDRVSSVVGRLRYARSCFERETKFMRRGAPESNRFYRGYDTLCEVIDSL